MPSAQRRSDFDRLPEYLRKPVGFVLTFKRTLLASLKADPELLVRNPKLLSPPVYAGACTTATVIIFKTAWPDDPIKTFQYPEYFSTVAPILEIIPLPLFTFAAAWLLLTSLPMYALTQLMGYKPRLLRIYHATVYSQFSIVFLLSTFLAAKLVFAAPLSGYAENPFASWPVTIANWAGLALTVYLAAMSFKLLARAHGVAPWLFFGLNFLAVGFPLVLIDVYFPNSTANRLLSSVFQPQPVKMYTLPSQSMWPNLPATSHIVENRLLEKGEYRVGDVVIFDMEGVPWVKRIVARGGESVQLKMGRLFIDGVMLERTFLHSRRVPESDELAPCYVEKNGTAKYEVCEVSGDEGIGDNTEVFDVPEGYVFLMGDNRDNSADSRFNVGPVPMERVSGKAYFVVYPRELGHLYKSPELEAR